ncbi:calcium-binding protein [Stagnihabitans tardus]|uniref:Calcium-binding protein n=1 Tax=Stagnihabitans tardus TaxID=2699202 RepID=A0AAE5BTR5_9RHOB|nr:calcium-binding protein [Stagnihabitans tardus]NBZ86991.1 hypothetical protein [Stagnihabitans tardus]
MAILETNGAAVTMTLAEFLSWDRIVHSLATPWVPISITLTTPGAANLGARVPSQVTTFTLANGSWHLTFGGEFDRVLALGGNDWLDTGSGKDTVFGGAGRDTVFGGLGEDLLQGEAGADLIHGGDGNDTLTGGIGSDRLYGGAGNDQAQGDDGNDLIDGGEGNDTLQGGIGNDTLSGGAGNDLLQAGAGRDALDGGLGDDTYVVGLGQTLAALTDAGGNDVLIVTSAPQPLAAPVHITSRADLGLPLLTGIETLRFDDKISFSAFDDVIELLTLNLAWHSELSTSNPELADCWRLGAGNDSFTGAWLFDAVDGGTGDDRLFGMGGDDLLRGGAGNDYIDGGLGRDTLVAGSGRDTLVGGEGNDRYYISDASVQIIEIAAGGGETIYTTVSIDLRNIPNVESLAALGSVGLSLTGTSVINLITGGVGNDTLDGQGARDSLTGGLGDDTYIINDARAEIFENANGGIDTLRTDLSYVMLPLNIEHLVYTGSGNFTGNGWSRALSVTSGAGNDTLSNAQAMYGGEGDDTYYVSWSSPAMRAFENADGGHDTLHIRAPANFVLWDNIEDMVQTGGIAQAHGNALDNEIWGFNVEGGAGNDTMHGTSKVSNILDGGLGNDVLIGGVGNDTFVLDSVDDVYSDTGGTDDRIRIVVSDFFQLQEGIEAVETLGVGATVAGNAIAETFYGGDGDDIFDGGAGADRLFGGGGHDAFYFWGADLVADYLPSFVALGDSSDIFLIEGGADGAFDLPEGELAADAFVSHRTGAPDITARTRFYIDYAAGSLWYDPDGSGQVYDGFLIAWVSMVAAPKITADNFFVI